MTPIWTLIPTLPPAATGAPMSGNGALAITLLLSGGALLVLWGAMRARDAAAKRTGGPHGTIAGVGSARSLFKRRGGADAAELASVARDVEELAERLAARMDERAERLERLIEAADERLARLEHATGETPRSPVRAARGPTTVRTALSRIAAEDDGATPAPEPKRVVASAGAFAPDPINGKVYELADMGKQPAEIAAALDEHIGKVQLILALREA